MSATAVLKRARTTVTGGVAAGVLVGSLALPLTVSTGTAAATAPLAAAASSSHPYLDLGSTGPTVTWLQRKLHVYPHSGYFWTLTRAAVKEFQSQQDLPRTGHVGRATWGALDATFGPRHHHRRQAHGFYRGVMRTARHLQGVPYVYGGTSPRGFDCSGYTRYVFARHGVSLPRVASDQYAATRHISRSQAHRGDLVAFPGSGGIYHIGIYAGHNHIWHSPYTGSYVHRERIWTSNVLFGRVRH